MSENQIRDEALFHDQWALSTGLDQRKVLECFEAPTAMENKFILRQMGPLQGKTLLDLGAGLGESSVYFALKGATVTAVDVSPEMVRTTVELGRHYNVEIEGIASPVEHLDIGTRQFDIVYVANTIHHVENRAALFDQINRALKPGGRFFSWDPIAYNPVIGVYRRMATEVRTVDESPLTTADLRLAKQHFKNVQHREFWISTLALFIKYYIFDRLHPNADRYWKRILGETPKTLGWWMPLRALDQIFTRLPLVRWLAWNMVMWGEKKP